jgi:exonuclease III
MVGVAPSKRASYKALSLYGAIWHGQKSWNGVAILVRGAEPAASERGLPGNSEDVQSHYIEADINGITIGCLCLPKKSRSGTEIRL